MPPPEVQKEIAGIPWCFKLFKQVSQVEKCATKATHTSKDRMDMWWELPKGILQSKFIPIPLPEWQPSTQSQATGSNLQESCSHTNAETSMHTTKEP